jgi:thiaminase/transcriptional activator TenA
MATPLHELLWEQNLDIAEACLGHGFVRGIADGSLDQEIFRRYVAQDSFYLESFARAYALAAARSERFEDIQAFHSLLGGVVEEKRMHGRYAESLGISLSDVMPNPACRAYTDFLLSTAWQRGVDEILAAMTPCMRLYLYLGEKLAAGGLPDHGYRDWIRTYSSEELSELVAKIEALLDHHAADTWPVRDAYRYAMTRELDFFAAVFEQSGTIRP